ncbi:hypothetical protein OUZ56_016641 [Daphnia magna]|uniref:Uncharacterized protein n=1 Tax=Daphnia magna TaxID=35525 RepID=A0ABR0AR68_9CRUS|nr:hypothetical protein OUZ56_016641 [Daphnia magna]
MDTLKLIASDSVQQGTTDRTLMLCVLECLQRIAGMQKTMDGIETKLSEKFQSIIEKMCELENKIKEGRKLDVFKMAKEDFSHHKCVVESHLKELPVKSSHAVVALNVALRDEKLSVSLVFLFIQKFRTAKTVN